MSDTCSLTMGERGRAVIPAPLCERHRLSAGARVFLVETGRGLILMSRERLKELLQEDLHGVGLLEELLAEDAGTPRPVKQCEPIRQIR